MSIIKKAIFPIAGLGTRFLPATKSIPKEMLTVLDRPVIEWAVIEAANSGIEEMIFVISSKKNSIIEHFDRSEILENILKKKNKNDQIKLVKSQNQLGSFSFVIQNEPKGLGHAVWCAKKFLGANEDFAVILPDDIILSKIPAIKQLMNIHSKTNGGSVVGLEKVQKKEVSKYGVIKIKKKYDNYYSISDLKEKPKINEAPSSLTIVGRYLLNSRIFSFLSRQKKGYGNEIQLTDSLIQLINKPGLYGTEFSGKRFDCGSKFGFIEANINFGLNDNQIRSSLKGMLKKL
ncbi:MAG: UTP--glucose-1-phosphate uridylyltransferase [Pseudomonadota bacterium]|nr:UTP--glucose-1-phosphate uridylyltransferase [Pseudomonadota bacterium]